MLRNINKFNYQIDNRITTKMKRLLFTLLAVALGACSKDENDAKTCWRCEEMEVAMYQNNEVRRDTLPYSRACDMTEKEIRAAEDRHNVSREQQEEVPGHGVVTVTVKTSWTCTKWQ